MNNPYINLLQYTWTYGAGMRGQMILYYTFFVVGSLVLMLQPLLFGLFLNTIQTGGPEMLTWIIIYLALYGLLELIKWCFHGPARYMEREFSLYVEKQLVEDTYRKLMELPLRWHKDHHSGETVSRIQKASKALRGFVDDGYMYIETLTRLVAGLIALLWINAVIGLFGLIMAGITLLVILRFDKKLIPLIQQYNNHEHRVHSLIFDYITNSVTVLILRLENRTLSAVEKKYRGLFPLLKKQSALNEWKWFSVSMLVALINFSAILYYCMTELALNNVILVGTLVALYQYLERFINQFFNFTWHYEEVVKKHTDFTSIFPLFQDHKHFVSTSIESETKKNWKNITIQNLSFAYEDTEHHAHTLQKVNLHFERGKTYAFIGESGSGKSTLLTLLRGIEEMDTGSIFIDGKEFHSTHVLSNISTLCPQDPEIFENTIEYNITVDVPHTQKELTEILQASRFAAVLERLPKGIKTDIKEKGVNLSGGEKQRLALARGLFAAKNSSLLLLDEPTSSVDTHNEKAIYEAIFALHQEKTVISSIHRLHLLPLFDYIYLFDQGQLVQNGSFDELIQEGGHFSRMWEHYKNAAE